MAPRENNEEGRIQNAMSKVGDWLDQQEWYQELRSKWDEIDPEKQLWIKVGALGGVVLAMLLVVGSAFLAVESARSDVSRKVALVAMLQSSGDELKRLKDSTDGVGGIAEGGPWSSYFDTVLSSANIDPSAYTLSSEKQGAKSELNRESLFDISLKHVTVKQVIRFANALEAGPRPVKLKTLEIDTKSDPTGYMDAKLSVSAFKLVAAK